MRIVYEAVGPDGEVLYSGELLGVDAEGWAMLRGSDGDFWFPADWVRARESRAFSLTSARAAG